MNVLCTGTRERREKKCEAKQVTNKITKKLSGIKASYNID